MKRYTISDIARMANVSPASVSRVLSGSPGVNKEKREEILRVIQETNYHPSPVARSLVRGKSNVVGLIVRDLENQYYSSMAVSIQKYLMERGYMAIVFSVGTNVDIKDKRDYVFEISRMFDFAGLFISVPSSDDLVVDGIRDCNCPVVLMNRTFDVSCDQITQNDFQAGFLAGNYLIELGHRDFLVMSGPVQKSSSCRFRMEGFRQALALAGIELDEDMVFSSRLDMDSSYQVVLDLLRKNKNDLPTAAFINGNSIALGFIKACGECSVRIPDDLSVVTVDNPKIMDLPGINLTTVSVPMDQMAKEAVAVLLERIESKREKKRVVVLQPELIIRGSTAPPAK